jgi:RHH-type rel operon transcriptional repressor/antitoxin RelB
MKAYWESGLDIGFRRRLHCHQAGADRWLPMLHRRGCMATTVRLDPATEQRLDQLSQLYGHTKAFYLRQLNEAGLDNLEDACLGAALAKCRRLGQERIHSLDDVVSELGLNQAAL